MDMDAVTLALYQIICSHFPHVEEHSFEAKRNTDNPRKGEIRFHIRREDADTDAKLRLDALKVIKLSLQFGQSWTLNVCAVCPHTVPFHAVTLENVMFPPL